MSFVYFIAAKEADMVKIGFATDPWKRLSKVQSDCPHTLTMLAVEAGTKESEAALHRRYAGQRLRGEWFRLAGPIAAYIRALPTPIRPNSKTALGGALGAWMFRNEHTVRSAAKLFGMTIGGVSQTCAGKNIPRRDVMLRIYEATNGEVTPNAIYGIDDQALASARAA